MDGLNALFRNDPAAFLEYNMLHPNPSWGSETHVMDPRDLQTGVQTFDILKPDDGSGGIHQLKFYDRGAQHVHHATMQGFDKSFSPSGRTDSLMDRVRGRVVERRATNEPPLIAHWLPFRMNSTFEIDLDARADLFFTAGLSGCTVVVSGDPQAPHVAHINRMDGAELDRRMERYRPRRRSLDPLLGRNLDGGYEDLRPVPTKAEATTRQLLMQEIKAAAAARAAGTGLRGRNYPVRHLGNVRVGGAQDAGGHIFGVVDFELHYKGPDPKDATANFVGYRNTATGNWRFVFQTFSSDGHRYYIRDRIRCAVCKERPDGCGCPA